MLSLLLAILSSASIAWLFKITEGGSYNRYRVTTANYGVAFFVSLVLYLFSLRTGSGIETTPVHWLSVIGIGIPAGFCFFLSFVLYQKSVKENGASLSGMFGKLGILLPMVVAIVLWKEVPSLVQSLGILLAVGAMVYVNQSPATLSADVKAHAPGRTTLLLLFLAGGMAEFSSKLFQKMGSLPDKNLFLFVVFFTAFCLSVYKSRQSSAEAKTGGAADGTGLAKAGVSAKADYLIGGLVGIPNLLSSVFLISALGEIPAAVAFPIYSSGAIALISIGSFLFFKEAIGPRARLGLVLTMIAMVLVNI